MRLIDSTQLILNAKNGKFVTMKEIIDAPEIDPIVHGRWLPVDEKEDAFDCSVCDAMVKKRHNFCPKCGAKMDLKG